MKQPFTLKHSIHAACAALTLFVVQPAPAQGGIEVGILTCKSRPGTRMNFIVHSKTLVDCTFAHSSGEEHYNGETGIGLGIDLHSKTSEQYVFAVLSVSDDVSPEAHALAGTYIGGRASAAFGIGAGGSVLFGGGDRNFSLKPVGIETSTGIGAAAGVGYLSLD